MKGQERLDKCITSGLVKTGTRFLYRNHGIATGRLWEGRILERVIDDEDGKRAYVRLDDSREWQLPENIFVELIFPDVGPRPAPDKNPAATATSAPAGDFPRPSGDVITDRARAQANRPHPTLSPHQSQSLSDYYGKAEETVPMHQQTTKTTKTTQRTKAT